MLSDIKILDFTRLFPGPYATMVLGDLGAEVLKIEHPDKRDLIEFYEPINHDSSAVFHYINRNKRRKSLDLHKEEDKATILELITTYDIIIEGFKPGVMKKFGLDYASLLKINKSIIYISISGYGQGNDLSRKGGHDINFLALSGISTMIGSRATGPILPGIQFGDLAGGSLYSLVAILSAIIHRMKTGRGQYIDVSLRDCLMSLAPFQFTGQLVGKKLQPYTEYIDEKINDYGYYKTSDARYLAIAAIEPKFLEELCSLLEIPHIKGKVAENRNDEKFKQLIQEKISARDFDYWVKIFSKNDICVEPVLSVKEAAEHPLTVERRLIVPVKIDSGVFEEQIGHPIKYSDFIPNYSYNLKSKQDSDRV